MSSMSKPMKKPIPIFVHYGFAGGVSCSAIVSVYDENQLAVGTTHGKCILFSPRTHLRTSIAYVDSDGRSIVAVGQFTKDHIFIHVRAYAIVLLSVDKASEILNFCPTRMIQTEFYGFCGSFCHASQLFCPLLQADKCLVGVFAGVTEQMSRVWSPDDNTSTFMAFSVSDNGYMTCGFETGEIKVVNIDDFLVIDQKKVFPEPVLACASFANILAVSSVKPPLMLISVEMDRITIEKEILFPHKAGGCSSLSFSSCGKELASGYWNGTVRINSVRTGAIRAVLDFHSETINDLCWTKTDGQRLLFVCSKDTKLSIWNLYND
uniref:WD_REPEATS_REGION domain-containing protein n=1 Tax=Elaeophora elaphi TaxID=1147741 RepID=A0A0R3RPZ8_9BILA